MKRLIFAALGLCILQGCWNKDFQEPGRIETGRKPTDAVLNAGYPRIWAATQTAMARFPMLKKDSDLRSNRAYVVTDWIRGKSDILYHGFDINRVPYTIRYKLFVYLTGSGSQTKISIKSVEQYLDDSVTAGVDLQGGIYTWVKTESSSLKEFALIEQINKLALDPQFKGE